MKNREIVHVFNALKTLRLIKLLRYLREFQMITRVLNGQVRFLWVFLTFIFIVVLCIGSLIFAIEKHHGSGDHVFTSIPMGMWWAVVTITTVGYGDMVPATMFGKCLASVVMLIGYCTLAVPTILGMLDTVTKFDDGASHANSDDTRRSRLSVATTTSLYSGHRPNWQSPTPTRLAEHQRTLELMREQDIDFSQIRSVRMPLRPADIDDSGNLHCSAGFALLECAANLWLKQHPGITLFGARGITARCLESAFRIREGKGTSEMLLAGISMRRLDDVSCAFDITFRSFSEEFQSQGLPLRDPGWSEKSMALGEAVADGRIVYQWLWQGTPMKVPAEILGLL
eukprot:TRINITY_DN52419_c0_g1_i1.p1 TRINITY_DN52419_c0_g1~~TRINITY_DN52419_c0_g1_i1.p1  ORF type:complete len:341 (+),score=40.68 TRINITY_DN52419_c0_g1_i1:133-1155(+)